MPLFHQVNVSLAKIKDHGQTHMPSIMNLSSCEDAIKGRSKCR